MNVAEKMCPTCQSSLQKRFSHYVEVDLCAKCGGLWLDHGEFDALVARRFVGHEAERDMAQHTFVKDTEVLHCPIDHGPMVGVEFDGLALDFCPECRGIWLDGHEREVLASHAQDHPFDMAQVKLPRDGSDHLVNCSGCGKEVSERTVVHVKDKCYCEECVVSGHFSDLEKHIASISRGHRVRTNSERHAMQHTDTPSPAPSAHLPSAVRSSVEYLKHLFD